MDDETGEVECLTMGRIASFYYMRHQTMAIFAQELGPGMDVRVRAGRRCRKQGARVGAHRRLRRPTCVASCRASCPCLTVGPSCCHCCPCRTQALLPVLCAAAEYDELPVRHNEDRLNVILAQEVRWPVDTRTAGKPDGTALEALAGGLHA